MTAKILPFDLTRRGVPTAWHPTMGRTAPTPAQVAELEDQEEAFEADRPVLRVVS